MPALFKCKLFEKLIKEQKKEIGVKEKNKYL